MLFSCLRARSNFPLTRTPQITQIWMKSPRIVQRTNKFVDCSNCFARVYTNEPPKSLKLSSKVELIESKVNPLLIVFLVVILFGINESNHRLEEDQKELQIKMNKYQKLLDEMEEKKKS